MVRLTETGLKKQVGRLRGFSNYDGLKEELLRVLWAHAAHDEHAERVITSIIDSRQANDNGYTACPTPAELIAASKSTPAAKPNSTRSPKRNCPDCQGTGFARDYVLATREGDHFRSEIVTAEQFERLRKQPLEKSGQAAYQGVHRCHCVAPTTPQKELANA